MVLLNNAVGAAGQNVTACGDNMKSFMTNLASLDAHVSGTQYSLIGEDVASMIGLVDPITETCFYAIIS